MPHLESLLPYKLHLFFPEAEAAETQVPDSQTTTTQEQTTEEVSSREAFQSQEPSSKEISAPSSTTSTGSGASELGISSASFKVDDFTGAGHGSYPIIVPPGRNGLNPNLSLNYLSAEANGWLGVGWDLSVEFIQRRGVKKGVPKYNDTDVFKLQLGGGSPQELVSIGGGEYRLRIEGPYLKIKYYSAGNYWELWDKSGVKMRFGWGGNSRIDRTAPYGTGTFRWCLDRVEDPKTNYMEITYQKPLDNPGQVYLQEIKYNG